MVCEDLHRICPLLIAVLIFKGSFDSKTLFVQDLIVLFLFGELPGDIGSGMENLLWATPLQEHCCDSYVGHICFYTECLGGVGVWGLILRPLPTAQSTLSLF